MGLASVTVGLTSFSLTLLVSLLLTVNALEIISIVAIIELPITIRSFMFMC